VLVGANWRVSVVFDTFCCVLCIFALFSQYFAKLGIMGFYEIQLYFWSFRYNKICCGFGGKLES
jgi:hypothetical protein